jgi:hypothetical protein
MNSYLKGFQQEQPYGNQGASLNSNIPQFTNPDLQYTQQSSPQTTQSTSQLFHPAFAPISIHMAGRWSATSLIEEETSYIRSSSSQADYLPTQPAHRALAPISTLLNTNLYLVPSKNPPPRHVLLPVGQYLGYYKFEEMYCPYDKNNSFSKEQEREFREIRRAWLAKLGIDEDPYWLLKVQQVTRQKVEERWALEPPEKRRELERTAIYLKHGIEFSANEVPLRATPQRLLVPLPLTFASLEQQYFNLAERNFVDFDDIKTKRRKWLADLGLKDGVYREFPQSPANQIAVEGIYEDMSVFERSAIEAKAKYLKLMLKPRSLNWSAFEAKYEIYPRSVFFIHTHWIVKRKEWVELLRLKYKPFDYLKIAPTDADNEALEAAWATISPAARNSIEEKAHKIKESANPLFQSFSEVESVFGYTKDKEKYFTKHYLDYNKTRDLWFEAIGMTESPSQEKMDIDWAAKSIEEKKIMLSKAREERERFGRDRHREAEAKMSIYYKAGKKLNKVIKSYKQQALEIRRPWS